MIAVLENPRGTFTRLSNNPVLLRLDGKAKAPLRTLVSDAMTDAERAAYGVFLVPEPVLPAGKRIIGQVQFRRTVDGIEAFYDLEDIPAAPVPVRTPEEKLARLLAAVGMTIDELKQVLGL